MKILFIFFTIIISLNASVKVIISKKDINYKAFVDLEYLQEKIYTKRLQPNCTPVTFEMFNQAKYIAKHYIPKYRPICTKDIKRYVRKSVAFDFGSFEIEKVGEVIQETDDFVKIKKRDGKIEKIYKDGYSR